MPASVLSHKKRRPATLRSVTYRECTDHGNMYVTITYKVPRKPFEVFVNLGKTGTCESTWIEALTRSITAGIRRGVPAFVFAEELRGLACEPIANGDGFTKSPADGLSSILREFMANG